MNLSSKFFMAPLLFGAAFFVTSTRAVTPSTPSWQGEWSWGANDEESENEFGGHLSIKECDKDGCAFELETGSMRSVCQADGRLRFRSPTEAVHELQETNDDGKKMQCTLSFKLKGTDVLETGASGERCSYYCGVSGNFGADFTRVKKTQPRAAPVKKK